MSPCIKPLLVVVVVASMLDTSISCSCGYAHEQASFCYGDLAYTFKVVAEEEYLPKIIETVVEQYDYPLQNEEVYDHGGDSPGQNAKPGQNRESEIPSLINPIVHGSVQPVEEVNEISLEDLANIQEERRANSAQSDEVIVHAPIQEIGEDHVNITEIGDDHVNITEIGEDHVNITEIVEVPLPEPIVTWNVPQFKTVVISETVDWSRAELRYKVENFKLYQGDNTLSSNTSISVIHTSHDGAMCGVKLNVGSTYAVIGGQYYDGQLHMELCNSYTDISRLNTKEREIVRKNFAHRYAKGCNSCKIVSCVGYGDCEGHQRTNKECVDGDLTDQDIDYTSFQTVCSRRKSRCGWLRGSHMLPPKPSVPNDSNNQ